MIRLAAAVGLSVIALSLFAQDRPATTKPQTLADEAKMRQRAGAMTFLQLCTELAKVVRHPDVSPRGEQWERIVTEQSRVPANDVPYIRERRLRVGMDECSAVAAMGKPDTVNRTNHANGRSDQLVYRARGVYIYTENGIVRAWQE